jgi:hypothetical protein
MCRIGAVLERKVQKYSQRPSVWLPEMWGMKTARSGFATLAQFVGRRVKDSSTPLDQFVVTDRCKSD